MEWPTSPRLAFLDIPPDIERTDLPWKVGCDFTFWGQYFSPWELSPGSQASQKVQQLPWMWEMQKAEERSVQQELSQDALLLLKQGHCHICHCPLEHTFRNWCEYSMLFPNA